MEDIAIYGSNGFGCDVYCIVSHFFKKNIYNFVGFFDDTKEKGTSTDYGKILGGINELNSWNGKINILLAIGYPKDRQYVYDKINNPFVFFPNILANNIICYDANKLKIGKGNIICPNSLIGSNVKIGNFNVLNGINLGHDVIMGDFNTLMPGVHLSGHDNIGNRNLFGLSSVVIENITIGSNTTICPLSAIYHKTKDSSMYIGNPAKLL